MIRDTSAQDRVVTQPVNRRKPMMIAAVALVVLAIIAAITPTAMRLLSADSTASTARLRIAEVRRGDLVRDVSVQGTVVAANSPTLYARNGGTVSLEVQAGDKVEKGEVLAVIDSPELSNRLKQEQATLDGLSLEVERASIANRKAEAASQTAYEQAVIDRETAEREVERNRRAFEMGAQAEMPVLRARDALAKARLGEANARRNVGLDRETLAFELKTKRFAHDRQKLLVDDLARQVDELKMRSPVDGQVGQLLVQQRANVVAGAGVLSVVDLSAFEIEVRVPETFARELGPGMSAEIQDANGKYAGQVSAISPEVVDGQVVGRIRFSGDKPEGLRQNQRLTTRILMDEHPNVLMVERGPFVDSGAGRVAYVVRGQVAERTPIQVGATSLNAVEIVSGVKEGDRIVISGTDEFKGAQRVALN
ncbi:MAG: HlyD family efflux transporter periplasmic adaptor subunit [Dokdonella sp.]|uniref:efflux RND transporter periplasmic adaptor subunit n=1 Tax=Dokdonella sp. TaxID=2291710 RepID=UPI0025BB7313|nr:HlyD family efflux transporter periplasmic adaptor subunit [Dokdonella sp.]MBZ0222439.1 HlyD family efflux transporter periplasmic adaptor subunit [Dokdonella sp.]